MNKVKSLSQQNLSLLLAIYIGIFLNLSVFYRRFDSLAHGIQGIKLISAVTEVIAIVLFTFFIMRLVSLGGRLFYRIVASLLVLISVAASYYMTFFNVVIGYGIVVSVMTTDIDLSKEVVGLHFVLWMVALSALPLLLIWKNSLRYTLIEQLKTPGHRIKPLLVLLAVVALVWLPLRMLDDEQSVQEKLSNVDLPSYGGVVALANTTRRQPASFAARKILKVPRMLLSINEPQKSASGEGSAARCNTVSILAQAARQASRSAMLKLMTSSPGCRSRSRLTSRSANRSG